MVRVIAALVFASLVAGAARASNIVDPRLRFRTLATPHFIIYFHQGEDATASRLAAIAEDAWRLLQSRFSTPPPLTHVVLADQAELANGSAFPFPRNTITILAAWPAGVEFIGNLDDWLRLVFTHELTHIVHLDRSEGWARIVRSVFGRSPYAFPNLFLPTWQIEGLATYEESVLTGEGRLHAGDFGAVIAEAARADRLEPLDRINGGLIDWPSGTAPYAYGLGFHEYLSARYGPEKLAALATATARRLPYTGSRAFRQVYGRSLGDLWRDYQQTLHAPAASPSPHDDAVRLTHHGFSVSGPRFDRSCGGCSDILYSVRTPHALPSLNVVAADGSSPRRLATRFFGSTTASGAGVVYFDQQEISRNVGTYSDLYALDRATGRVRRLTHEARLLDPDLSPDGKTIVAVQQKADRRDVVLVRLEADATDDVDAVGSEPETQFNAPRWSPDGRRIAVERHRLGALSEIVVVDAATRAITPVAAAAKTRWVTPAWRDDRVLVAAAAKEGEPFNLYDLDTTGSRPPRQLTQTTGGTTWPDVSPDGKTIVYVGYTADGFDLFRMTYPAPAAATAMRAFDAAGSPTTATVPSTPVTSRPYAPLRTLAPTWWSPIVESDSNTLRLGAATAGADVLGYHGFGASATWLASTPAHALAVDRSTPDWQAVYVYDRWQPTLFASASRDTSFFAGPPTDAGVPETATLRERELQAGLLLPIRRFRWTETTLLSVVRATDDFTFSDRRLSRNRTAARAGFIVATAHTYGYSVSPERGLTAGATTELVRSAFGASADATAFTADARAYLPGLARHHVVALRGAAGTSSGDRTLRRTFDLGGAGPDLAILDFGRDAIALLRGFPAKTFAGRNVALLNADYRLPLAYPQRGLGTWPIFLQKVHAAVFADAGHAWSRRFAAHDLKSSAGAELSADVVAGYALPLTLTLGAAYGHDGSRTVSDRVTVYFRIGRAF